MSDELKYQLRLTLRDPFADAVRNHPDKPSIAPLTHVLQRHDAVLKCQHDAFADYVREAEANGVENYPLYDWTKQTVNDPVKEAKYVRSFTLYVGGDEVYDRSKADALQARSNRWSEGRSWRRCFDTTPIRHTIPSRREP